MPPRHGPPRLGRRIVPAGEQDVLDIESIQERSAEVSPPRAKRRVEMEAKFMDVIQDLRQEMTKLRAENRALRDEMHRERQQVPPLMPPAPVPQPPPAYAPPPAYVPRRVARRVLDDEGVTVSDFL